MMGFVINKMYLIDTFHAHVNLPGRLSRYNSTAAVNYIILLSLCSLRICIDVYVDNMSP